MDIATIIGIALGIVCTVVSILLGGSLLTFYNLPSIFVVVGGGIASTLISCKAKDIGKVMQVVTKAFFAKDPSPSENIKLLVDLSQRARREGLLSLEAEMTNVKDEFLSKSIQLVVDGVEPEVIKDTMDLELVNLGQRHSIGQGMFKTMAAMFPAWGMIGTLIGLILLLNQLDDPSKIGPAMAVALITTFYGSVLANLVCTPIANKLAVKSKEEVQLKEMIIEGVLSIQAGENPRIMEQKLITFLSTEQKIEYKKAVEASGDVKQRPVQS